MDAFFMQRSGQPPHVLGGPMLLYYLSFDDRGAGIGYPTSDQVREGGGRYCQAFEGAVVTSSGDGTFALAPNSPRPSTCLTVTPG